MSGRNQQKIVHQVQTGGEITINLILTIKLDNDGISVSSAATEPMKSKKIMKEFITKQIQEDEDDVDLIIPDIDVDGIIQFGNKVED